MAAVRKENSGGSHSFCVQGKRFFHPLRFYEDFMNLLHSSPEKGGNML